MSNITSEDCKDFLVKYFKDKNITTYNKEWKRKSKYKENDLWHRDFLHSNVGEITVIENEGNLSIKGVLVEEKDKPHPKFTKAELEAAKILLQQYVDNGFGYCYEKEHYALKIAFMESDEWKNCHYAIPGLFTFSFPDDTYDNDISNVTNGLDTFMKINNHKAFTILILNQESNVCENYEQEILKEKFLPSYTEFLDEYHLTFNPCPENLTIGQAISYLESLGLIYSSSECLFKDYIKQENEANNVVPSNLLTINDSLNDILVNDNVNKLKLLIDNGLNINIALVNKNKLVVEAFKNNAYSCIEEIFRHKDLNILLTSEGYNPDNKITVASEILEILNFNDHKYRDKNYINLILERLPLFKEDTVDKYEHIITSTINSNKLHPYHNEIISKIEQLIPEDIFNSVILKNFQKVSSKDPQLLEKTLYKASVGTLSNVVEQHALMRDYKIVLFLLDKKLINPQNVMVHNKDLKTFMAIDINNYQKEIKNFIKDNMNTLSVTYQKKDKSYASELESMKADLNVMYKVWQHINPSNKLKN